MARLEIISAVIYEALLAFQLCISGRGNELMAKEVSASRCRYYASYVSNSNPLIPSESRSCCNYTFVNIRLSRELQLRENRSGITAVEEKRGLPLLIRNFLQLLTIERFFEDPRISYLFAHERVSRGCNFLN